MCVAWVASAKKEDTERTRLEKVMEFAARGERINWMYGPGPLLGLPTLITTMFALH